jgi:putative flavoprotein involved in K+ transport
MTDQQIFEETDTVATGPERVETVVIGAGQTGLATAYHLQRAGRECVVLDEHPRVGGQWRTRYDSLRLNTPAQYDSLPGMRFPARKWSFPSGHDMADYLEAYAGRFGLDVRSDSHVMSVDHLADGSWLVTTAKGAAYRTDNVVVGTGGEHHPRVPAFAHAIDPGIRQIHAHDYRNPGQLLPGPVLVVGAGQSGADLALEIAQAGHETTMSGKVPAEIPIRIDSVPARFVMPVIWFMWHHVLTLKTPIGRKAQWKVRNTGAPLVRVKVADLETAGVRMFEARTDGVDDEGRPMLDDGQVMDVANVVWCTGFRQDFSLIHPNVIGADGWPTDSGGVMEDLAGLYFVGLLFQRGFYSMLIGGAGRDAKFIAGKIAARARSAAHAAA